MVNLWTAYVITPMVWCLNELAHFTGSYALAIIVFTVFIKLALYPLTFKQLKSSRAQQALQPQLQELKAKHGNDKVKLNEETMRLYKENNANPIAGCLPTLIQFPILIGLYNSLYTLIREPGVHASFLWIKNLALPDFWSVVPPGSTQHIYNGLFILPVLAGGLQWIQQRMMMNPAANQDPQQKMMNQMMQFMPLMVIFFGFRFPAGLALYWVTNTLVSIIQTYFIVGFGSLVFILPFLRGVGSPALRVSVTPPTVARDAQPPKSASKAAGRASVATARTNGRTGLKSPATGPRPAAERDGAENGANGRVQPTSDSSPNGTTDGAANELGDSRNGQVKATPGSTSVRRTGPGDSRSRSATRKQGSKR